MRLQNWLKGHKVQGESNSGVSQTQPDMTMSLSELLRRHASGRDIPTFEPTYEGDDFFPDPRTLDLADVHDMATRNAEHIEGLQSSLRKGRSGAKPASRKSAVANEASEAEEARLTEQSGGSKPTASD